MWFLHLSWKTADQVDNDHTLTPIHVDSGSPLPQPAQITAQQKVLRSSLLLGQRSHATCCCILFQTITGKGMSLTVLPYCTVTQYMATWYLRLWDIQPEHEFNIVWLNTRSNTFITLMSLFQQPQNVEYQ